MPPTRTASRIELGPQGGAGVVVAPDRRPGDETAPAIVLLPAISGVSPYILRVMDRLVGCGYTALAVDYFARAGERPDLSSPDRMTAAVAAVSDPLAVADVAAATKWLQEHQDVDGDRVAVLGFCLGGSIALLAAAQLSGLCGAVAFYGVLRYYDAPTENKPTSPLDAAGELRTPLLGHWGDADHIVPLADVLALREEVSGRDAEVYLYPGAGHAFHDEDRRGVYRPVAAAEAWARTLTFLDWRTRATAA